MAVKMLQLSMLYLEWGGRGCGLYQRRDETKLRAKHKTHTHHGNKSLPVIRVCAIWFKVKAKQGAGLSQLYLFIVSVS